MTDQELEENKKLQELSERGKYYLARRYPSMTIEDREDVVVSALSIFFAQKSQSNIINETQYFYGILRLLAIKLFRGRKLHEIDVEIGSNQISQALDKQALTAYTNNLVEEDAKSQIIEAIAMLPEKTRNVISLHAMGLTYAEIAETLKKDERTIRRWMRSAREEVKLQINKSQSISLDPK